MQRLLALVRAIQSHDPYLQAHQLELLMMIASNSGISVGDLAELLGVSVSSASRSLVKLGYTRNGLVRLREDPEDRRKKRVELSRKGTQLLESLIGIVEKGH